MSPVWWWSLFGDDAMPLWWWGLFGDEAFCLAMRHLWWWDLFGIDACLAMSPVCQWCLSGDDACLLMITGLFCQLTLFLLVRDNPYYSDIVLVLSLVETGLSHWSNKTVKRCCRGNRLWFFCKWGVNWIHFVFSKHLSKRQGFGELRVTKQSRGVVIAEEL